MFPATFISSFPDLPSTRLNSSETHLFAYGRLPSTASSLRLGYPVLQPVSPLPDRSTVFPTSTINSLPSDICVLSLISRASHTRRWLLYYTAGIFFSLQHFSARNMPYLSRSHAIHTLLMLQFDIVLHPGSLSLVASLWALFYYYRMIIILIALKIGTRPVDFSSRQTHMHS